MVGGTRHNLGWGLVAQNSEPGPSFSAKMSIFQDPHYSDISGGSPSYKIFLFFVGH